MDRSLAKDKECAIYWDYENVGLPHWCSPAEAAKRIYAVVAKFGRIVERRLYFDYQKQEHAGPRDCSGLDLSGFDLVNTPTRNSKETLDKKLIADVLTFAWDCTARNTEHKPCVVLITSDGDYAYTLAKLRDRGVMNIVMYGKDCSVAQILVENADVALSFDRDVLEQSAPQLTVPPSMTSLRNAAASGTALSTSRPVTSLPNAAGTGASAPITSFLNIFMRNLPPWLANARDFVQFIERDQKVPVQRALLRRPTANPNNLYANVWFMNSNDGEKVLNAASESGLIFRGREIHACLDRNIPTDDFIAKTEKAFYYEKQPRQPKTRPGAVFNPALSTPVATTEIAKYCVCLHNQQLSLANPDSNNTHENEKLFVAMSPFGTSLSVAFSKDTAKDRIKSIMNKVVAGGYMVVARQEVATGRYAVVPWHKNRGKREGLTTEAYLRLTAKGRSLVQRTFQENNAAILGSREQLPSQLLEPELDGNSDPTSASSPETSASAIDSGISYKFSNLPPCTEVHEFVEFIQGTYRAPVECATLWKFPVWHPVAPIDESNPHGADDAYCCVYLQFANAYQGHAVIILAALNGGITFKGKEIKVSTCPPMSAENAGDGTETECYTKSGSLSALPEKFVQTNELLAIPAQRILLEEAKVGFCTYLFKEQKTIGNVELWPVDRCWVRSSVVGTGFRQIHFCRDLPKEILKDLLKAIRTITSHCGLIEIGRRKLHGNKGFERVPLTGNFGKNESLSAEIYLRLTNEGISLARSMKLRKKKHFVFAFLQNLPWPMQIIDLVRFLEAEYSLVVRQAHIVHHDSHDCCDANVELSFYAHDEDKIRQDLIAIHYSGREIRASLDCQGRQTGPETEKNPLLSYVKSKGIGTDEDVSQSAKNGTIKNISLDFEDIIANIGSGEDAGGIGASSDSLSNRSDDAATTVQNVQATDIYSQAARNDTIRNKSVDSEVRPRNNFPGEDAGGVDPLSDGLLNNSDNAAVTAHSTDVIIQPSGSDNFPISAEKEYQEQDLHEANCANSCDESCTSTEKTNNLGGCGEFGSETTSAKLTRLARELDGAIQAKNFVMAGNIQADIERLEKHQMSDDIERITHLKSELNKELTAAVEAKDFARAATIQEHIEGLKEGVLSGIEASAFLKKSFDTELAKAIEAKDFAKAGKIQARIESLE